MGRDVELFQGMSSKADVIVTDDSPMSSSMKAISSLTAEKVQKSWCFLGRNASNLERVPTIQDVDDFRVNLVIGLEKAQIFRDASSLFAWIHVTIGKEHETVDVVSDFARKI